jgi:hypothetical protein
MAIKTLSIPAELDEFLNANPDLSPSKMLQSKIKEIMENRKLHNLEIGQLQKRLGFMERKLWEANDEIDRLKNENANENAKLVKQKN